MLRDLIEKIVVHAPDKSGGYGSPAIGADAFLLVREAPRGFLDESCMTELYLSPPPADGGALRGFLRGGLFGSPDASALAFSRNPYYDIFY